MTVVLHFATALSTLYFRKNINTIFKALQKRKRRNKFYNIHYLFNDSCNYYRLCFESQIEKLFELDSLVFIGFMLIVTGILLLLADKTKENQTNLQILKTV